MKKVYLYTILLISLFGAGLVMAGKTNAWFYENEPTAEEKFLTIAESQEALASCSFSVQAVEVNPQERCKQPLRGEITANVSEKGTYTYKWYKSSDPDAILGINPTLSDLETGSYLVVVTDTKTGCEVRAIGTVGNDTPNMLYKAHIYKDVIGCSGVGFGSLWLEMLDEGNAQNLKSKWYDINGKEITKYKNMLAADNLVAGTYTITVENNNTGCVAEPFVITIGQLSPPVIQGVLTNNTLCVGGDGIIDLTITTEGPAPANGFNISWSGPASGSTTGVTSTYTIPNLPAGTYTVTASDPADAECTTIKTFEVLENISFPSISLTSTPNNVCVPTATNGGYNGEIEATATEKGSTITDFTNYSFTWADTNGNPLAANTSGLANQYVKLQDGNYQVSVTNTITGCTSGFQPITVGPANPTIALSLSTTDQTNCEGTPNGTVTVEILSNGQPIADYTNYSYKWYSGISSASGTAISPTMSGNKASDLEGGKSYTVLVTDNSTGCTVEEMVSVGLSQPVLALTLNTTPNTICASSGFDGTITADVTLDGAPLTNFTGYTFSWTAPDGTQSSSSTNVKSGLQQGIYQVSIKKTEGGCASTPKSVEVLLTPAVLDLNIVPTDQTYCEGTPNGTVTVEITKSGTAVTDYTNYSYKWFSGISSASGTAISPTMSGNKASDLEGGKSYTVVVTDGATGCTVEEMVSVGLSQPVLALTLNTTPNTICASTGFDGTITADVTVDGAPLTDFTGYTFSWTAPDGTQSSSSTNVKTGLQQGNYQVSIKKTEGGCASTPKSVEVLLTPAVLDLNIVPTDQTYCEGTPNGTARVEITKSGTAVTDYTNYSYKWFSGISSASGTAISPTMSGNKASDLEGGKSYTVLVTDKSTGCTVEEMVSVGLSQPVLALTLNTTPNTICASTGFDGTITADVTVDGAPLTDFTGYTFSWTAPDGTQSSSSTNVKSGLQQGNYQVSIKKTEGGCASTPKTVEVLLTPAVLDLNIVPTDQTYCEGTPNGTATVEITKSGTAVTDYSNYSYKWYSGISSASGTAISPTMSGNKASDLEGGKSYTVLVTDNSTGCTVEEMVSVGLSQPVLVLTLNTTPNTICASSGFDGTITADVTLDGAPLTNFTGYTFSWTAPDGTESSSSTNVKTGLQQGNYQVSIKKTEGGCASTPKSVEVLLTPAVLDLNIVPTDQTYCEGTPNGTATVEITKSGTAVTDYTNYSYKWFSGISSASGTAISPAMSGNKASDLEGGKSYTVIVTDNSTGCTVEEMVSVGLSKAIPQLEATTIPNAGCDDGKYTGEISLAVTVANNLITDFTDYSFTWTNESTGGQVVNKVNTSTGLKDGPYRVKVKNTESGCESEIPVTVGEKKAEILLSLTPTAQTNCEGADNGEILTEITKDGIPITDFSDWIFNVYAGTTNTGAIIKTLTANNIATALTGNQYYTIEVIDPATACVAYKPVYVPKDLVKPVILTQSSPNEICSPGITPSGSISVSIGAPTAGVSYIYELKNYDGSANSISGTEGAAYIFEGLLEGQYRVIAKNASTGCISLEKIVEVGANKTKPTIALSATDNTNCSAPYNGKIKVSVAGLDDPTGYSYQWKNLSTGALLTQTTFEVDILNEGTYEVTVTVDSTGCQSVSAGTIHTSITTPKSSLAVSQDISCGQIGELTANVVSPDASHTYTIIWYRGQMVDETKKIKEEVGTTSILDTLENKPLPTDYYTIVVKNNETRCESEPEKVYLKPPPVAFVVKYEMVSQPVSCDTTAGVVTAYIETVPATVGKQAPSKYKFTWYKGKPEDPDASFYTDPKLSFPAGAQIMDLDPENHASEATISGKIKDIDYFAPTSPTKENGQSIYKRGAGTYTVVVEDTETGCSEWISVIIPYDGQHKGSLEVVDIDDCQGNATGSLIAQVLDENGTIAVDQSNYTFRLFTGSNAGVFDVDEVGQTPVSGGEDAGGQTTTISGLAPGWYTIVAIDNNNCRSIEVSREIKLIAADPVVMVSNIQTNEQCTSPNGGFTITVGPGEYEPGSFDQKTLFFDITVTRTGEATPVQTYDNVAAGDYLIGNLTEGDYEILVQGIKADGTTVTCETSKTQILGHSKSIPVVTATSTDQDECSPANGTATITGITFNGSSYSPPFTGFDFSWKDENGTDLGLNTSSLTGLPEGTYTVTTSRNNGYSAGCPSAPVTVTIDNISTLPIIDFATTPNGDCDVASGTLTATATTHGLAKGPYTFNWFIGEGTAVPFDPAVHGIIETSLTDASLAGNQQRLSQLIEGKYTLQILEGNCDPVVETYEVESVISEPVIVAAGNPVPNTHCPDGTLNYNGSFQISSVSYNTIAFTNTAAEPNKVDEEFKFTLYHEIDPSDPANAGVSGNLVQASMSSLAPGTYYLLISKKKNPGKDCGTMPYIFIIEDKPAKPAISLKSTPNDACDPAFANGTVTASVFENGNAPTPGFTIEWFQLDANGNSTPLAAPALSNNGLTVSKLPAGKYKAVAKLVNGCPVEDTIEVTQQALNFNINLGATANTACESPGTGTFTVTSITHNGTTYATAADIESNFGFVYYESEADYNSDPENANGTATAVTGSSVPQKTEGTYFVVATKKANPGAVNGIGCKYGAFSVTVPYAPVQPSISLAATDNNSCDPATVNGSILATVNLNGGTLEGISWYRLDANGGETLLKATEADLSDPMHIKGLPVGNYKAVVRLTNGCTASANEEVTQQALNFNMVLGATANTACESPGTGTFTITSITHNGSTYATAADIESNFSFVYYESEADYNSDPENANGTATAVTGSSVPQKTEGTYFVVATKKASPGAVNGIGCKYGAFSVSVPYTPIQPAISLAATDNNSCDPATVNGSILATVNLNGGTLEGISWYRLDANGGETLLTATEADLSDPMHIKGLPVGNYKAVVKLTNGCTASANEEVAQKQLNFNMVLAATANTACESPGTGTFTVTSITHNGTTYATAADIESNFGFVYYESEADYNSDPENANGTATAVTGSSVPQKTEGTYFVVATKKASPGAVNGIGCKYGAFSVSVPYTPIQPAISLAPTDNNSCDPATVNGSILATVNLNGGTLEGISWYRLDANGGETLLTAIDADLSDPMHIKGLPVGNYKAVVRLTNGCTASANEEVTQQALNFNMVLGATANTACESPGTGTFTVTSITHNGSTYATAADIESNFGFVYYESEADYNSDPENANGTATAVTGSSVPQKTEGTYFVVATKKASPGAVNGIGCKYGAFSVTVPYAPVQPSISLAATDNNSCDPATVNGSILATVNLNSGTLEGISWYRLDANGGETLLTATEADLSDPMHIKGLPVGNYKAVVKLTNGCTASANEEVTQQALNFNMVLGATANTACESPGTGTFTVTSITHNGSTYATAADIESNFGFVYYESEADYNSDPENANGTATAVTGSSVPQKTEGTYFVVATKKANPGALNGIGCKYGAFSVTITHNPVYPEFNITGGTNNNDCSGAAPNGTLQAAISRTDGLTLNAGDYEVKWYAVIKDADGSESLTDIPASQVATDMLSVSGLRESDYKAVAILNGLSCPVERSYTLTKENFDYIFFSDIQGQVGCNEDGIIRLSGVSINNNPASLSDFNYRWYKVEANGDETELSFTGNELTGLAAGTYRLKTTKSVAPGNGCGPELDFVIPFINADPIISITNNRPESGCNNLNKGKIDISVSSPIATAALQVNWFIYTSYNNDPSTPDSYQAITGNEFGATSLDSAYYRVEVYDATSGCSTFKDIFVGKESASPTIMVEKQDISHCTVPDGEILIKMNGKEQFVDYFPNTGFQYIIEKDGALFEEATYYPAPNQADHVHLTALGAGTYTISYQEILENGQQVFGCPIPGSTVVIEQSPNTMVAGIIQTKTHTACDPGLANAELTGTINGSTEDYKFEWYEGVVDEATTNPSIVEGVIATNLKTGSYTLIVTNNLTTCKSLAWYTIEDAAVNPVPTIVVDKILEKCDAPGDARISANVNGSIDGYTFEWFNGAGTDGIVQSNEATYVNIGAGTYTVKTTSLSTGCQGTASYTIDQYKPVFPVDTAWIISTPSTSCLEPNGTLEVGVDAISFNYSFTWYEGAEAKAENEIASGVTNVEKLAAGIYTVVITNNDNGCHAESFTKVVEENYYFPQFEIKITPATCIEDGYAEVVDLEGKIPFYEWYDENQQAIIAPQGTFSGPAGKYYLKIVSDLGCSKMVPVEINSAVLPYNAVTMNGDGQNDYFFIDCIQMFPKNRVRIYNRAGTLVYETIGYDNSLNVFAGIGNRGIYLNGNELPVGTYFYVIDKNFKNEKPQTGFLEILR